METQVWLRVPGDIVFAIGTLFLAGFALRLLKGGQRESVQTLPVGASQTT
jgi:nitric oxide reductase subunit B